MLVSLRHPLMIAFEQLDNDTAYRPLSLHGLVQVETLAVLKRSVPDFPLISIGPEHHCSYSSNKRETPGKVVFLTACRDIFFTF